MPQRGCDSCGGQRGLVHRPQPRPSPRPNYHHSKTFTCTFQPLADHGRQLRGSLSTLESHMPFIEHFLCARPLPSSQIAPPAPREVGTIIISVLQTGHHCSEAVSGTRSWVMALMRGGAQAPSSSRTGCCLTWAPASWALTPTPARHLLVLQATSQASGADPKPHWADSQHL